jgi:uncharacterized protein
MGEWKFDLVPAPSPGTKVEGHVDWRDRVLAGWDWPYIAVRGEAPGPAVLITAGVHGSEYVSIDAVVRLAASLNPAIVAGQILCLPLMNPAAFWERTAYVSPIDNLNLNRVFPGKATGSFSERLAFHLVERAFRRADAYMDMHGGDVPEALLPFNLYYETGNSVLDARSRAMAETFGAPALIVHRSEGAPISGLAYATAAQLGVPAFIAEDGGAGQYDAAIAERMQRGLENVLRSLKVIPGAVRPAQKPRQFYRFSWVRSKAAGFFRATVKVGDELAEGQPLGELVDFFNYPIESVVAADRGQVLFLVVSSAIAANGLICGIGVEE